jgi:uncharacterized protein YceK
MKSISLLLLVLLLTGCGTVKERGGAMDKFFDCLGDSSKCKDIMNKKQKETFEKQISDDEESWNEQQ